MSTDKPLPKIIKKEELKRYVHNGFFTVGRLKKFLAEHDFPDDAPVLIERVEDKYFENSNWGVYLKEGEHYHQCIQHNDLVKSGEYSNKENYPDIKPENIKLISEEELEMSKTQYHPVWCCVRYNDDKDILFIDAHY